MSYNGSGTFQINSTGQPVVSGTVISSTAFNALTADLATGLSTAITKDGQTATTARIPFAQGISSTLVTDSTSTTTGSIITAGGAGVAKALFVGTTANVAGAVTLQSTLGVTGVTTVQAGTAALPAITTTGDTNTGIFFPAADTIAFAEGGVERARIDSSGNLGLGVIPSPWNTFTASFQIDGASLSGLGANNTALASNAYYQGAWKYYGTGSASLYQQNAGQHAWSVAGSGTAGNAITFTQAMTLDASGNVGIGTSSPKEKLDSRGAAVFSGDNATGTNAFGTAEGLLLSTGSGVARITAVSNGANNVNLALRSLSSGSAITALTINSTGAIALNGAVTTATGTGITFPATQSASSDANTLDDYEEGTWTPSLGGNTTYIVQTGLYTKVGRLVFVRGILIINLIGTGSTTQISGLPFANASGGICAMPCSGFFASATAVTSFFAGITNGGSVININSLVIAGTTDGSNAIFGNNAQFQFSGCYSV